MIIQESTALEGKELEKIVQRAGALPVVNFSEELSDNSRLQA